MRCYGKITINFIFQNLFTTDASKTWVLKIIRNFGGVSTPFADTDGIALLKVENSNVIFLN